MGRSPSCSSCSKHEEGLHRGAWTASEDKILSEYIKTHGVGRLYYIYLCKYLMPPNIS
jgi:myb proto-oncogene protein